MKIGILALQGAFIEHKHSLDALGVESFEIRQKKDIEKPFDGLIIPGGESTVIGKLLHKLDLYEPIKNMIEYGGKMLAINSASVLASETLASSWQLPLL